MHEIAVAIFVDHRSIISIRYGTSESYGSLVE